MKRSVFSVLFALGGVALYSLGKRSGQSQEKRKTPAPGKGSSAAVLRRDSDAMRRYMLLLMLPLWVVPGILDYLWHRRTKIQRTSGTEESLTHALMMIEAAPAILAGLFLEINAGVIALMIATTYLAHEATATWDLLYTAKRRPIPPGEQHTHSYLEMVPFCLASFAVFTHWDQFLALIGQASEPASFPIRLKQPPLPTGYVLLIVRALGSLVALPHAEELWRCWREEHRITSRGSNLK